ncbi:VirB4 family type IV secretion system protein [Virgibacillus ihumii]|uniref:VirB4 family type IV secretion system protein n=1 Tax=Virgibacillus ihumii TaxID=2686091 RepID=UPI00157D1E21|nr:type IV secretion system protein VirB4 [Virgibacillus ihumii]
MFTKQKAATEEKQSKKPVLDKAFLAAIQPQGGVSYKDKYMKKGDGYEACIHVWEYPQKVDVLWMDELMSMYDVTVVSDIATMNQEDTVNAINKSMMEQDVRHRTAKHESDRMDAQRGYTEMEGLYEQISKAGEVIKLMHIRLYVASPTIWELEQKVNRTMSKLKSMGFKGQIFLNESFWEWQSMFLPYERQLAFPNKREGKGMSALTLASGLPYHFSELNDERGSYFGTSFTGGNVLFDLFHRDKMRRFYNAVVVGKMGAGKSTTLKKLLTDNAARGDFIRGFEMTGEFNTLVKNQGGHIVSLDGSDGIINILQIFRSDRTDEEQDENDTPISRDMPAKEALSFEEYERLCFMQHISKVAKFYEFMASNPETGETPSTEELDEFKKVLRQFYQSLGFMGKLKTTGVTTLQNDEYPIFGEFLTFLRKQLYEDVKDDGNETQRNIRNELSPYRVKRLETIELTVDNMVNTYEALFNGHTSLPDITNEQIIFFSIRNLRKFEKNVFQAQMFNALNLIWDNLIQIGAPQKQKMYHDDTFSEDDITRFLIMIDEAHRLVNPENMLAVSYLTDFAREARKFFGGLILASQSIRDFVPDHSDTAAVTKIRTLFELTQYKFIMQQDSNTLDSLRAIFEGQLTESELDYVPQLQQGECVLSISGVGNLMFSIEASEQELQLFEGGL